MLRKRANPMLVCGKTPKKKNKKENTGADGESVVMDNALVESVERMKEKHNITMNNLLLDAQIKNEELKMREIATKREAVALEREQLLKEVAKVQLRKATQAKRLRLKHLKVIQNLVYCFFHSFSLVIARYSHRPNC